MGALGAMVFCLGWRCEFMVDSRRMARPLICLLLCGTLALAALAACNSPSPAVPDGRLVFERKAGGNSDVFEVNVDGSGLTQLTDAPGWDGHPSWSPDGSQIVFASDRAGGPVIYVMNADGSDPRALTEPSYASLTPAWSPDGRRIAFASSRPDQPSAEGDHFAIWVMGADGSGLERVASDPEAHLVSPTWGPKSDRVAYERMPGDGASLVTQVIQGDQTPEVMSLAVDGRPSVPAWSPSGRTIAFVLDRQGVTEIWQARPDGSDARPFNQEGAIGSDPAWSPDGKQIVFVSTQGGGSSLVLMDATGKNVRQLISDGARYAHPDWR